MNTLRKLQFLLVVAAACLLTAPSVSTAPAPSNARDPRIEQLLAQVSEQRVTAILQKLGSFGTRNTLSSTDSPARGIGAARQWILDEMKKSSARLQVAFDTYTVPRAGRITREVEASNVVAVLPGKSARRVYITAHYDTFARVAAAERQGPSGAAPGERLATAGQPAPAGGRTAAAAGQPAPAQAAQAKPAQPPTPGQAPAPPAQAAPGQGAQAQAQPAIPAPPVDNPAPGVNDDGSGTAVVMELARVFAESGIEFDATLVFAALFGEEQGLIGAQMHAAKAQQDKVAIDAVLNNDMVGNTQAPGGIEDSRRVRVFSEGPEDSASRQLARYVKRAAALYVPTQQVTLVARHDRFGRGGDHTAFNQKGFTAVRITEAVENYERQHTTADTFEGVNVAYLMRNLRLNGAAAAALALAPPAPSVVDDRGQPLLGRQPSGYDANLRWKASPGAAGYKVYWRAAWTPDWEHEIALGPATEHVIPNVSIDDYVFGVAAIGPDGNESLVAAYVNPPRR